MRFRRHHHQHHHHCRPGRRRCFRCRIASLPSAVLASFAAVVSVTAFPSVFAAALPATAILVAVAVASASAADVAPSFLAAAAAVSAAAAADLAAADLAAAADLTAAVISAAAALSTNDARNRTEQFRSETETGFSKYCRKWTFKARRLSAQMTAEPNEPKVGESLVEKQILSLLTNVPSRNCAWRASWTSNLVSTSNWL